MEHHEGAAAGELRSLDELEIHTGMVFDDARVPAALPRAELDPRLLIERRLADVLRRGECHVLFSGGRDSSVMLALAVHVARREGLPMPVPLTARFERHPRTWEQEWQEATIEHLRLDRWSVFEVDEELDALGPLARGLLTRHGLYWPSLGHTMSLFAQHAGGGTMLTGGGGDELFSPWLWRRPPIGVLRQLRPRARQLKWSAYCMLPLRARQELVQRRRVLRGPEWLRPAAQDLFARRSNLGPRPRSWAGSVASYLDGRYLGLVRSTVTKFAEERGVELIEPFYERDFVAAVARQAPSGFTARSKALSALFGDLLPTSVLSRSTKATFTEAFWGPDARAFAEAWDGEGLDVELVDVEAVRSVWASERPDVRSITMLHRLYLQGALAKGELKEGTDGLVK